MSIFVDKKMNHNRAMASVLVAAFAPLILGFLDGTVDFMKDPLTGVLIFGVWYFFLLLCIFPIAIPVLHLALQLKYGPWFIPLAGTMCGFLIENYLFGFMLDPGIFTLYGFLVSTTATLFYFRPWKRDSSAPKI